MLPCNWLQVMENRGDQHHAIYLHGRLFQYALERQGRLTDDPYARYNATMRQQDDRLKRGAYPMAQIVYNKYGFTKGMRDSETKAESTSWTMCWARRWWRGMSRARSPIGRRSTCTKGIR
jgi:hypothetical protein